ncbi:alcohol dehydrogenase catalytic domain-containing protein [Rhodobacteraceae bacterium 2CG4]|uniref:Alcohol dehydrogenase catalytic domain-containing protein n=1 Tax=Halovulum marinum TaxID=2662447 RepID=A0A6L5YWS0_9RHOB|nr:zinc-binding alcohol dehydrogenase family protein [Halovulum marinum]MSU88312.1 alcohol dehydrogenase catalytic domain-containing protein [Halovulum marinum]
MRALRITAVGRTEFAEIAAPRPGPGEVLVEVRHVGLCGSDLNTFRGANPLAALPRIPGHEIGGVILGAGPEVPAEFAAGRRVTVIPYTTCGACAACLSGRVNACRHNRTLGVQQDGALAERIVARHDRLILNDSLPAPHLALVEPLSVGFHAVGRGRVTADDTVAVLGGGMIGVGAMLGARARGARVLAVEPSAAKHDSLRALGAEAVIDPGAADQAEALAALTGGHGPSVVIEAVGLPQTFRAAIDLVAAAGRVVYVGYAKSEVSYDTALFNVKELDIHGSRNATRADFETVIGFLEANPGVGDRLISRMCRWDEADAALPWWEAHRSETLKIMVDLTAV